MTSSKPGLFAREATGLVREIGFSLGVIIILTHVIGLGWQKRAFQFTGPNPMPTDMMPLGLPAIFWAFLVCGLIVLITGYAAGYVTAAMPRSGGGYVTISRVIHPFVGYMSGWMMFLAEAFSYGLIGVAVFEGISIFFGIAMAPNSVTFGSAELFFGGLAIVWIFAILGLLGTKMYGRLLEALFYIPLVITVLFFAMWIGGILNPDAVANGVTQVLGNGNTAITPGFIGNLAQQTGMTLNPSGFFDAFTVAITGAFWAYMGWYATTFLAGEVKEANKKLPLVLLTSGLIVMIVYLFASSLSSISAMGVGQFTDASGHQWSFFQSYAWLSYPSTSHTDQLLPGATMTIDAARALIPNFQKAWSTGIASMIARGMDLGIISYLVAIGGVLWVANDIPPFLLVASRTFFAMSFDRMMPERFAYVSERWHAPVWAIIITALFATPACGVEAGYLGLDYYFGFAGVGGTDIFDALFLTMFCVSCMLLPLQRREIYDRAAVKHSIGTVVGIGFFATLGSSFALYTILKANPWLWSLFTTGASSGDIVSAIGFFAFILFGLLLYLYHMYRNTTKGVDMHTLYLSIPPE